MAIWSRLVQSKIKALASLQTKARLFGSPNNGSLLICASKPLGPCPGENPIRGFIGKPSDGVRFFAASVQAEKGAILNEKIQFPIVRLVTDDGHHFRLSTSEALEQAKRLNLDLVLVQSDADPPVCKIFDYRKERYKKRAMEKERNKSKEKLQSDFKEVRFSAKTELRDLKMKAATIKRLMEDGYRVKCVAMPSKNQRRASGDGEDEARKELEALFASLIKMIADEAIVECEPVVKNGQAHIIVRHIKFGPSKKSGAKKSKDVEEDTPEDGTFSNRNDQQVCCSEDDWRGQQSRPILPEPPHAADDRCRVESRNQFSRFHEDSPCLQPQVLTQREQYPSNRNHSMDSSTSGGFNQPPPSRSSRQQPYAPQPPSGARVHPPPPNRAFKQGPLPPPFPPQGSSSPTTVYGVGIPGGQGVAAESNRYARKPNVPSFSPPSASIPGGQGVAAESNRYARKPNAPSSNPDGWRPGPDHGEQGAFGRFSRDGSRFGQSNVPKSGWIPDS